MFSVNNNLQQCLLRRVLLKALKGKFAFNKWCACRVTFLTLDLSLLVLALALARPRHVQSEPNDLAWKISMFKIEISVQTPTPTKKSLKHLVKSNKLVIKIKTTKNPLVALTGTSPPLHLATKLLKILIHKKMTWRTTQPTSFLSMTKAAPSQRVTSVILLILDLLALPALVSQIENGSAIVCLHPPCPPSKYHL
jgi:hypothetical protein